MCGIFGVVGNSPAAAHLIDGLKKLEYRGYDSAGIALQEDNLLIIKRKGKVANLLEVLPVSKATMGIAHTRWATYGHPSERNAHPHADCKQELCIVHNGIIENADALRAYLMDKGHIFASDTDSEVLAHLIEERKKKVPLLDAVRQACNLVEGTYGLVVLAKESQELICIRSGSPLIIGKSAHASFISSDIPALAMHTDKYYALKEKEIAVVGKTGFHLIDHMKKKFYPSLETIHWDIEYIEKGNHEHFMIKEILEQPHSLSTSIKGRVQSTHIKSSPKSFDPNIIKSITLLGCGTSWHAGLVAKYIMTDLLGMPVHVEYSSEFRYATAILSNSDLVIAISQSGETADTLAALRKAKLHSPTFGIVNVVGSSIAREVDSGMYIRAGPEIGVASTKAFTGQVLTLVEFALWFGLQTKRISKDAYKEIYQAIIDLPDLLKTLLTPDYLARMRSIAKQFKSNNALFLGRGIDFPTALEGALKLKEISYIHAEGYPAAEMKHGPIALIDENMPVVVIATRNGTYKKMLSNIQEVVARKGMVLAIASKKDKVLEQLAQVIYVPQTHTWLSPIVNVLPLQLLAYYVAVQKGLDPDKPRNLAKSVTVE